MYTESRTLRLRLRKAVGEVRRAEAGSGGCLDHVESLCLQLSLD